MLQLGDELLLASQRGRGLRQLDLQLRAAHCKTEPGPSPGGAPTPLAAPRGLQKGAEIPAWGTKASLQAVTPIPSGLCPCFLGWQEHGSDPWCAPKCNRPACLGVMRTGGVSGAGLRGDQPCPMAQVKAARPPGPCPSDFPWRSILPVVPPSKTHALSSVPAAGIQDTSLGAWISRWVKAQVPAVPVPP